MGGVINLNLVGPTVVLFFENLICLLYFCAVLKVNI